MDGPNSKLDSASTFNTMTELHRVGKTAATAMIVTLHQRSELVIEMADTLLLILKAQMCFSGAADQAAEYFQILALEQPPRSLDFAWRLDVINRDFEDHQRVVWCIDTWPKSDTAILLTSLLGCRGAPKPSSFTSFKRLPSPSFKHGHPATSFGHQTCVLKQQDLLNAIRNRAVV